MIQQGYQSVEIDQDALKAYSEGRKTAFDLRSAFNATFGDILNGLSINNLDLPKAPQKGRERDIERAERWLFPDA